MVATRLMDRLAGSCSLRQLQCVLAVAETGSVTTAAELLGLSQPSVSQQLARLEHDLGTQLFRRRSRGMVLTRAGIVLASTAREVVRRLDEGLAETRRVAGGAPSPLTVGVLTSLATTLLPLAVTHWTAAYPGVPLHLREELRRSDLEQSVRRGEVDIAVGAPPLDWHGAVEPLGEEELVLVVPPSRRPSLGWTVRLEELEGDDWVLYDLDHGLHEPVLRSCAEAGFRPRDVVRTRQVDTAVRLAAAGVGIAVSPVGSVPSDLVHLIVSPMPSLRQKIAVWALGPDSVAAKQLAAVLHPVFQSQLATTRTYGASYVRPAVDGLSRR